MKFLENEFFGSHIYREWERNRYAFAVCEKILKQEVELISQFDKVELKRSVKEYQISKMR